MSLLTGTNGQISLGHGAFMFIGAYTVALLVIHVPGFPFWLDLLLAVGLPALTQRFPDALGGSNGLAFTVHSLPSGLDVPQTRWQAWVVWTTGLLVLVLLANVTRGWFGRVLRAVRDDEVSAALSGIHIGRTKVLAFLLSATCGGLAGGLQAFLLGTAAPGSSTLALSLSLLAAMVLGGVGSLWGAFWGALALVSVPAWANDLTHGLDLGTDVAQHLPLAVFGVVLVAVVLVFPRGIHGTVTRLAAAVRKSREKEGSA